ncbi:MAG TPA: ATP-binding protein, partial [Bacteroidales bacterium]|nr:ATP-binding protein [Bacteroidales bacterium]
MKKLPRDWCYIYNFKDEDRPRIVDFPAGEGKKFQKDMEELVEDLKEQVSKAFEDGEYEGKRDQIIMNLQEKLDVHYHDIKQEAKSEGFEMKPVPPRFVFIPVKDGVQMPPDVFEKLSPEEKKSLDEKGRRLAKSLDETLKESQRLEEAAKEDMRELEESITFAVVKPRVEILKSKYSEFQKVRDYLDDLINDVVEHHKSFLKTNPEEQSREVSPFMPEDKDPFVKYQVNVFVNNDRCTSAPVVMEPNPIYYNLFGKLEYKSHMLSMNTDFTMLRPGAIHHANGGFLILQIRDILSDPYAWETLKKAVKHRKAVVENIGEQYRLVPAGTIRPEPMPLDLKIIIISDPEIYYLLYSLDDDLQRLFKVRVDFDVDMPRNKENLRQYVSFISNLCSKENLLPFSQSAVGKVIEYGSRVASDQNKLSTRFNKVTEVLYESSALAAGQGAEKVEAEHVRQAIAEKRKREDILEERIREQITKGNILIHTEGEEIGQINGLSVLDTGGYAFGIPTRITARTFAGDQGVINIERETEMSGSIHTKGVLTLSGYIGGTFAQETPLGLTAQITFEQSYGGIDGDSASSAELYA